MINPATGEFITEFGPLASAEVILLDEINRIPLEVAERVSRGTAGPHGHRRQDDLRAGAVQLCHRDDESCGAGAGDVLLSEAATDRFAIMINIAYLPPSEEESW